MPSVPRELTLSHVDHPATILGRTVVVGSNLHDLADRIKNGDPASGWEGDARMVLTTYGHGADRRVELLRLEHDGEYRVEARLRPDPRTGVLDPSDICRQLVARDARRGYDLRDAVDRHNAKVQKAAEAKADERLSGAADKLAWAIRKDNGVRAHWSMTEMLANREKASK